MWLERKKTMRRKHSYVKVYSFFDTPLRFTRRRGNERNLDYCHWIAEREGQRIFLIMKVSPERLELAEKGLIDLRTFLMEPEFTYVAIERGRLVSPGLTIEQVVADYSLGAFPEPGVNLSD